MNVVVFVLGVILLVIGMTTGLWIAAPTSILLSALFGGIAGFLMVSAVNGTFD